MIYLILAQAAPIYIGTPTAQLDQPTSVVHIDATCPNADRGRISYVSNPGRLRQITHISWNRTLVNKRQLATINADVEIQRADFIRLYGCFSKALDGFSGMLILAQRNVSIQGSNATKPGGVTYRLNSDGTISTPRRVR